MPIGGPKSDQTAFGDAIRKTAQETKKLYTRKLHGIPRPRTCLEIPRSSPEYQEALTKKTCKFMPRFRPYKVRGKRLRDDANPGQGQAQMPWNCTRKVSKGHPKRTKMVRNWCQNVPRSQKWRPAAKVYFFHRFWTDSGYLFGSMFAPKSYEMLPKSLPEIYGGKVPANYNKINKKHTEMMRTSWQNSDQNLMRRFLWFCREYNVILSFYHIWSVENRRRFNGKFTSDVQSQKNENNPQNVASRAEN